MNVRALAIMCPFSVFGFILSGCGGLESSPAPSPSPQLTPPAIMSHPSSQTLEVGQAATFTVLASGSSPLTYQWQKNSSVITGAISSSYTTPVVAMADDGSIFKVVVSNPAGSATSNPATLNVIAQSVAPSITQPPSDTTVSAGQTATFTVLASGSSPLAYQWQKNGSVITGATSSSYTTPAVAMADDGSTFNVVVSNPGGSVTSNPATLRLTTGPISLNINPKRAAVAMTAQTQQFTVTVSGDPQNLATWAVDGTAGGNVTVGTIDTAGLYTPPSTGGTHTIAATSVADSSQTASATIAVTDLPGVLTYHNNLARDGTNPQEYGLTSSSVKTPTFGKLFSCPVDGSVYAQPLWVPALTFNGGKQNAVFAATSHDSVYAFDADKIPCEVLWHASLLDSAHGATSGETAVPNSDVGNGSPDIQPEVGIVGTPVIDPASNTLFVVSKSEDPSATFHQRLHALDLITGNEKFGGPVNISASVVGAGYDSSGATVTFNPRTHNQRPGLALINGVVYITWASHGDVDPYHGWIIGYSATNLTQVSIYNVTADGDRGGIWMGGAAPAADSSNAIYLSTGNGTFDHDSNVTPNTDLGDSVLKLTSTSRLTLSDWFSPLNQSVLEREDADLGSSGVVLLPDQSPGIAHLLITGGKEGRFYLINRDSMGHFCGSCTPSTGDTNVVQSFRSTNALFGTPVFWQNGLYASGTSDQLIVLSFDAATSKFNTSPSSQTAKTFSFPGSTPSLSSRGAADGIIWAIDSSQFGPPKNAGGPAVLHAFDASNLAIELWNSTMAPNNRDQAGNAVKFTVPTVANGKVYIGTRATIDVYGLLPD
jgi:hypothetical protein